MAQAMRLAGAHIRATRAARSLLGIGIRGLEGLNPVRNMLLWILGICVTFGIGCIVGNAVLWWRTHFKRSRGAWWLQL